ncbi:MAG: CoA transferase [Deltaproteobacteria bacterium]|nr:CoA transferase [Deltaproteobacteria bacterium]
MEEKMRPLSDIRVLGLEQYITGPYCTMLLADAGAEVIKIEPPGTGDPRRSLPPFAVNERGERSSGGFMRFNRSKKSLTLDLKQDQGKEIFRALVRKSDVIVENFRPDTMERLGFSYEVIHQLNPAIIYASLSGFGRLESLRGPYWDRPGFDIVFQAMGGLMHNVGEKDGPPLFLGVPLADIYTPMVAAFGIVMALRMREKTGLGQYVDTAMYDCMTALNEGSVLIYSYNGEIPGRDQPRLQAPQCSFKTKDGYVALIVPTEEMWARFCRAIDREDLIKHPLLSSGPLRGKNFDSFLKPILDEWMGQKTTEEVIQRLLEYGVPVGPSQTAKDLVDCPQLLARNMILDIQDPVGGKKKVVGSPVKLSGVPEIGPRPAPRLGEHTEEILENLLGYSQEKIIELRKEKVI